MNLLELTNDQMVNTSVKDRLAQKKAKQQAQAPAPAPQEPQQAQEPAPAQAEPAPAPAAPTGAPAGAIVNMPSGDHFVKTTDGTWAQSDEKGNLTGRPAEGPNSAMHRDLEKWAAQTGVASSVEEPAQPVVQKTTPDAPQQQTQAPAPASQDIPVGTKAIFVKADKYINDPKMRKDVTVMGPSLDGKETHVNVKDEKNKTFNVGKDRLLDPKTKTPILKPAAQQTPTAPATPTAPTTATAPTGGTTQVVDPVQRTSGGSTTPVVQQPTGGPNTAKPVGGIAQNPQSTAGMSRSEPPSAEIDPKAGTINAPEPEGILQKAKRVGQGVVDKITTATGGSLATKTVQDPNANTGKKIGAKGGAAIGRAMTGGINALRKMAKPGPGQQPQPTPDAPQQQGTAPAPAEPQVKPLDPQSHRQLGAWQQKVLSTGDVEAAKGMVGHLSGKLKQGHDPAEISQYASAVVPVLKRNPDFMKNNQQLYTHLAKMARSMRTEAYEHLCKVFEHANISWEDLGYKVSVKESNVILFPLKELNALEESVSFQEMKALAGV